jgi:hypothetical protein
MIDVSLCPNPFVKQKNTMPYRYIAKWLSSLTELSKDVDASAGELTAALGSSKPLYVTTDRYTIGSTEALFLNVMVDRKDYRAVIGYENNAIVRVETLDARAARAETRKQLDYWESNKQAGQAARAAAAANVYAPARHYVAPAARGDYDVPADTGSDYDVPAPGGAGAYGAPADRGAYAPSR